MAYTYKTSGTCSRLITLEFDGTKISSCRFDGGCAGNLAGISKIVRGMEIDDVINCFSGIRCGFKSTSCPDQLARALAAYKAENDL